MKKHIFLFSLLMIQFLCANEDAVVLSDLPQPYCDVTLLSEKRFEYSFINQSQLERLFLKVKPRIVIESGTYLGTSTNFMAKRLQKGGKLYAVGDWSFHTGHRHMRYLSSVFYDQFLSNMIYEKNTDTVIPVKMTMAEAASFFQKEDLKADVIYIDASHDAQSVYTNLTLYYPFLDMGGVICGDDWLHSDVQEDVVRFAQEHGIVYRFDNNFWEFDPKERECLGE